METRIVCYEENMDEMKVNPRKKLIEKVLSEIVKIDGLSYVTQSEVLGICGVTQQQYNSAIKLCGKKGFCII